MRALVKLGKMFKQTQPLSSMLLLSKCTVIIDFRGVENKMVATLLNKIWDDLDKLYTFWDSMPKSKWSSSKSYHTLKAALDDKLMPAKLHCF